MIDKLDVLKSFMTCRGYASVAGKMFGDDMKDALVNDGPVTICIDSATIK